MMTADIFLMGFLTTEIILIYFLVFREKVLVLLSGQCHSVCGGGVAHHRNRARKKTACHPDGRNKMAKMVGKQLVVLMGIYMGMEILRQASLLCVDMLSMLTSCPSNMSST